MIMPTFSELPGSPIAPLVCTDKTADACKLKWEEPDKGLPISHYKVGCDSFILPFFKQKYNPMMYSILMK